MKKGAVGKTIKPSRPRSKIHPLTPDKTYTKGNHVTKTNNRSNCKTHFFSIALKHAPMQKAKRNFIENLDPEKQKELFSDMNRLGAKQTAEKHFENLGLQHADSLYQMLLRIRRKWKKESKQQSEPKDLTTDEEELLQRFQKGDVSLEEIKNVVGAKALKQILEGNKDVKVSDFLRAIQVQMKQDQVEQKTDAMERFVNTLFAGFIPAIICPHCSKPTHVSKYELSKGTYKSL